MSVHKVLCPECSYQLIYATLGTLASYRTDRAFSLTCAHAREIRTDNAMNCPTLRAASERVLRVSRPHSARAVEAAVDPFEE